jgi:hybrid cluster-associated redox disulfide protein
MFKMKITPKTKISEIIRICPESILILMEYGLMCAGCSLANNHGLEETKEIYGFSDEDVKEMIEKINILINEDKSSKK